MYSIGQPHCARENLWAYKGPREFFSGGILHRGARNFDPPARRPARWHLGRHVGSQCHRSPAPRL